VHDVIEDLCSRVHEFETLLGRLRAADHTHLSPEVERMTRKIELCERWLHAARGDATLRRQRADWAVSR
jgi:hypothetical protein